MGKYSEDEHEHEHRTVTSDDIMKCFKIDNKVLSIKSQSSALHP